MVQVTVSNNVKKNTVTVPVTDTLKAISEKANVPLGSGGLYLNGQLLSGGYVNTSLQELQVPDESEATLIAVKNADSAL